MDKKELRNIFNKILLLNFHPEEVNHKAELEFLVTSLFNLYNTTQLEELCEFLVKESELTEEEINDRI